MQYSDLSDRLARLDANLSAAEVHGMLTGLLIGPERVGDTAWLVHILDEADVQDVQVNDLLSVLKEMMQGIKIELHDDGVVFNPFLPEDSADMAERVDALGDWCHGLMLGLSEAGLRDLNNLSPEVQEWLTDLSKISQIGMGEDEEADEEHEEAFAELLEYIRIGVLTIHDELHPPMPQGPVELH